MLRNHIKDMRNYYFREVKYRTLALKQLPQDILDLESNYAIFCTYDSKHYGLQLTPKGTDDATRQQWVGQTIKLLERCGCVFPEKPTPKNETVTWNGELKIGKHIIMDIEISNCPIPLGCVIRKEIKIIPERIVPEHTEEVIKVVCLEDEREALNTPVEA